MKYKNVEEKLTAYALGELDELEIADVETLIANDDDAKRYVEDIRTIGGIAEEAFAEESLGDERHNAILAAAGAEPSRANGATFLSARMGWGQWGAIAAAIAVMAGLVVVSGPTAKVKQADRLAASDRYDPEEILIKRDADGKMPEDATTALVPVEAGPFEIIDLQTLETYESLANGDGGSASNTPRTLQELKFTKVKELMDEGDFYLRNQKFNRALELYEESLVLDPDNEEVVRKLAEATLGSYNEDLSEMSRDLTVQTQFIRRGIEQDKLLPAGDDAKEILPPRPAIPTIVQASAMSEELEALGPAGEQKTNTTESVESARRQFEITNANTLVAIVPEGNTTNGGSEPAMVPSLEQQLVEFDVNGDGVLEAIPFYTRPDGTNVIAQAMPGRADTTFNGAYVFEDSGQGGGGFGVPGNGGFHPRSGGLGGGGGGFGGVADPNSLDLVEQRTRVAELPTSAGGVEIEDLREQMDALGYLDNNDQLVTSLETLNSLPQVQLGLQLQTARVDNLAYITLPQQQVQPNTEAYDRVVDNPFKRAIDEPLSTFSIDVDTGSYANVRRFLRDGQLPPKDAVRIEELLNYFDYTYAPPANSDPFAAHVELVECPWNAEHQLMRIGLKGREVEVHTRPKANLVFLLDVSGSMQPDNKLPLVRDAMQLLTKQLRPDDRVAIVTYAGASGLALPSTPGTDQATILNAIGRLQSGGSTNGASGIELAYQVAQENFFDGGVNRVILATDGDFNVGITDRGSLDRLIEDKAKSGVFLTVLGVGDGNLKDATMEQLADKGNGQYAYLDSEREARKVLVEQVGGTLVTIAKDVKVQIDFNPMVVGEYRLIGYENRVLAAQDFDDDTKDAGEIGAGHTVTALYEITPPTAIDFPNASGTQSRYISRVRAGPNTTSQLPDGTVVSQLLTVKLRHKLPESDTSTLLEIPITAKSKRMADASRDVRFAASVAAFGMALRESPYRGTTDWDLIANLAEDGLGDDPHGYRAEFMELIQVARALKPAIELQTAATEPDEPILLGIRKWTGGTYVAEIRTQTGEAKYFGVGDGFDSFKVISIDPAAQEVKLYSEAHRRERTLGLLADDSTFGVELLRLIPSTGGKYLLELKIGDSDPAQYNQDALPDGYRFVLVDPRTGQTVLHSAQHGKNFILMPKN